jgi:3-methyl-2-oxobutanoate hydroxymethyltransferase
VQMQRRPTAATRACHKYLKAGRTLAATRCALLQRAHATLGTSSSPKNPPLLTSSSSSFSRGPHLLLATTIQGTTQGGGETIPSTRLYSTFPRPTSTKDVGKRETILELGEKYRKGIPLVMLTAKDFPSAVIIEQTGGVDIILVGDSLGMTTMGYETTIPVTVEDMLHHCKSVYRGNKTSFLIGDMPFGSYEPSNAIAVSNAMRFMKEGGMSAVKLEGGRRMKDRARAIVESGIPVMGHIGLTPQSIHSLGGFRVQGKTGSSAFSIYEDALALQDAGCFAVVLECIPERVATEITKLIKIPTIGIGSGKGCSGQVLVWDDMIGQSDIQSFHPKFLKKYANVGDEMRRAVTDYKNDVLARTFPEDVTHTFPIKDEEFEIFLQKVNEANKDKK